jgi:hypothetical protein
MPHESIPRCCCHRCNAAVFGAPVEVVLAFHVQGQRLDGHSDRGKLLLRWLRQEVQNGLSLQAAGAAGGFPRLPPQWLALARVQRLCVYVQKTQGLLVVRGRAARARHQGRPSGVLRVLREAEGHLAGGREQSRDHLAQSQCEGCIMAQGLQNARQLPYRYLAHVPRASLTITGTWTPAWATTAELLEQRRFFWPVMDVARLVERRHNHASANWKRVSSSKYFRTLVILFCFLGQCTCWSLYAHYNIGCKKGILGYNSYSGA